MTTERTLVEAVNVAVFFAFWALLFVGTTSTLARVAYYRAHGFRRPRLLVRDAVLVGGFAISFGLILLVRVLRDSGLDTSGLSGSLWWTLATSTPALTAVGVYVWFELRVIERGNEAHIRDEAYAESKRWDDR